MHNREKTGNRKAPSKSNILFPKLKINLISRKPRENEEMATSEKAKMKLHTIHRENNEMSASAAKKLRKEKEMKNDNVESTQSRNI